MVNAHYSDIPVMCHDDPSLIIILLNIHAEIYMIRFDFGKDSNSAIAFFDSREPVMMIPEVLEKLYRYLVRLGLCFLETDNIRIGRPEPAGKAFAHSSPDPVEIIGYDFFHV